VPDGLPARTNQRRLRSVLIGAVVLALLFFVFGFIAVRAGWIAEAPYLTLASIVGGIASLVGLLSLARPSITTSDLEGLELDALTRVSRIAQELENAKRAQAKTRTEIEQLELQRQQMEVLVRKAALLLFLREKVRQQEGRITEKLAQDNELARLVETLRADYQQLESLAEEVSRDPNADVLAEVIDSASRSRQPTTLLEHIAEGVGQVAGSLLGRVIR